MLRFLALTLCCISILYGEVDFEDYRKRVLNLGQLELIPKTYPAKGVKSAEGIEAIYYDGLPYRGKATRVFAYLGLPKDKKSKLPAMVLVHGGGGTAFIDWVKKWNDRGYAAISIATEGQLDIKEKLKEGQKRAWWQQHEWAGPKRAGIYADDKEPLEDQWMYHAVADVVLAQNLLRSFPEIDSSKIGLMGISWGGIITSTVMGIDQRFAFAIPTYGCGALYLADNHYKVALENQAMYHEVWDPMQRMHLASMPALWYSWTGDTHFPLDVQSHNYFKAPGKRMVSYVPNMKHGHQVAWNPEDSYAFADSIVKDGKAWGKQIKLRVNGLSVEMTFHSRKKIDRVSITTTSDIGHTAKRKWKESPLKFSQDGETVTLEAELPKGTTSWFVNCYHGKLVLSSDFQTLR